MCHLLECSGHPCNLLLTGLECQHCQPQGLDQESVCRAECPHTALAANLEPKKGANEKFCLQMSSSFDALIMTRCRRSNHITENSKMLQEECKEMASAATTCGWVGKQLFAGMHRECGLAWRGSVDTLIVKPINTRESTGGRN